MTFDGHLFVPWRTLAEASIPRRMTEPVATTAVLPARLVSNDGWHPMSKRETREEELVRLCEEQRQTRRNEVFGGLSPEERNVYDAKADRIHKLEDLLSPRDIAKLKLMRPLAP
jgi:hypothetical protein